MPVIKSLPVNNYSQIPETKETLDWAQLVTIDLSLFDTPEGKIQLAKDLETAIRDHGFFYLKNFGLTQDEVDEQFSLAQAVFDVNEEEKKQHLANLAVGDYNKFRLRGQRILGNGVRDNIETYNIAKFNGHFEEHHKSHVSVVSENKEKIERFSRYLKTQIVDKLLVLFAIILEVEENYLVKLHDYEDLSEDHMRYMKYYRRSQEENQAIGNLWSRGHTDLGTLTLLFRQPVAALQIQNKEGKWKWVKPQANTITVNICDTLSFLTAGYLPSTRHRVHAPPADQQNYDRIGVMYFSRTRNDLQLKTIESPKLERLGLTKNFFERNSETIPNVGEWVVARQKNIHDSNIDHTKPTRVIAGYTVNPIR